MSQQRNHVIHAALIFLIGLATATQAEDWPQFRGPRRDNVSTARNLLRDWPDDGPRVLWQTDVCQGYAAPAIHSGKVYINDYTPETRCWHVRCLALNDGHELWRYSDEKPGRGIRANHGITRTVPAVDGKLVFALDPKCILHCLDASTGKLLWQKHFPRDYGATIPPWYNGQCPLIEDDRIIVGVGGTNTLMVALDKQTGNEIWRTPNEHEWPLSHASVMPATIAGVKQYLWCTLFGPVGVSADDGRLLWHHDRQFNIAVAPSPLYIGDDRVFMTSGYDAGSIMLRLKKQSDYTFTTEVIFDWTADTPNMWNSEVHTPILYDNHMFAVGKTKRGLFTCLDLDGHVVWDSRGEASFGLGSFLLADNMFFILEGKTGMLRLIEASTAGWHELDHAQVLHGHDVWAPLALSDGKLLLRDMTTLKCVQVGADPSATPSTQPTTPSTQPADNNSPAAARNGPLAALGGIILTCGDGGQLEQLTYRKLGEIKTLRGFERGQFSDEIRGIAIRDDRLYVAGDRRVSIFNLHGDLQKTWPTERPGHCIAVDSNQHIYVGEPAQIEVFDQAGTRVGYWQHSQFLGRPTAIGFVGDEVLVADVAGRQVRRFDRAGKYLGDLVQQRGGRGFMVPNRCLDLAVGPAQTIHICNPGLHRIQTYKPDGTPTGRFGKFHGTEPAGFTGCCNPTNIAIMPAGQIVTVEKAPPRVKVYNSAGELLTVVNGPNDFDPQCKNMDVAVDSAGRIYVVDTQRLALVVYMSALPDTQPAAREQP